MIQLLWVITALVKVAFHVAFQIGKKALSTEYDPLHISFAATVIGIALYVPVVLIFGSFETLIEALLDPGLLALMALSGFFNAGIFYTSLKAMQTEDVSIVTPITQMYPVLVALMEPLLIGEIKYSPFLLVAAALAALGGYGTMLNDTSDALKPIKRFRNPGVQFAVAVVVFSAAVAVVDRTALLRSELPAYIYALPAGMFIITAILVLLLVTGRGLPEKEIYTDRTIQLTGVAAAGMILFTYTTFQLVTATQATIVFLLVAPATVIIGGNVYEEDGLMRKAAFSFLVVVGVAIAIIF